MENNTTTVSHLVSSLEDGIALFAITMCTIGVVANSIVTYLFIVDPYFRKMIYYIMLICCLSDLIANVSFIVSYITYMEETNTTLLCRIIGFLIYTSYGISIMNLSLISVYRYLSIVRPLSKIYLVYKKQVMIIGEFIIWMICIAVGLPDLVHLDTLESSRKVCDYDEITPILSIFLVIFVFIYYVIPSAIIIIFNWKIIIHQRNYIRPGQSCTSRPIEAVKKDKIIRSLMIVSACYVFTTWPAFAFYLVQAISRKSFMEIQAENETYLWLGILSVSTITIIAVLNPFLYFKLDENIRRSFRNQLLKKCCIYW